ncbi:hypothetical protein BC826DRAFT_966612 [Russula brevipes]|nr:hypothetical protein BC826DRAFT_966612 [Russula brevipes]
MARGKAGKPKTRYVSGQTKPARPRPRHPPDDSGEEFDFESVDRQESSSESSASSLVPSSATLRRLPWHPMPQPERPLQNFLTYHQRNVLHVLRRISSISSPVVAKKAKPSATFASVACDSKLFKLNPESFRTNFRFSGKTSNSTLRKHLGSHHKDELLRLREARGWKSPLPDNMNQANTESTPVSEARRHMDFCQKSFLNHLVDFIVADDQVSTLRCHLYHADFSPLVDPRY